MLTPAQCRRAVLAAVAAGHSTAISIARAVGVTRSTVYEHLRALEAQGRVESHAKAPTKRGKHRLWSVPSEAPNKTGFPCPTQTKIIAALDLAERSVLEIAAASGLTVDSVTNALLRMQRRGLVDARPHPLKAGRLWRLMPAPIRNLAQEALAERGQVNVTARSIEIADYLREVG